MVGITKIATRSWVKRKFARPKCMLRGVLYRSLVILLFVTLTFEITEITSLSLPQALAQATTGRTVYFAGSAVSNKTVDFGLMPDSSSGVSGCAAQGASDARCRNGTKFKCRVAVVNLSAVDQSVSATMNFGSDVPNIAAFPIGTLAANPFRDNTSAALTYNVYPSVTQNSWKANISTNSNWNVGPATPLTLHTNEMFVLEMSPSWTDTAHNIKQANGPNGAAAFDNNYPYQKIYHYCSGSITAQDTNTATPGFVIASGSITYESDSYQNPMMNYGGYLEDSSQNQLRMILDLNTMFSFCRAQASCTVNVAPIPGCGLSAGSTAVSGSTNGTSQFKMECVDPFYIHNQDTLDYNSGNAIHNASNTYPQHFSESPILINGGSPF